MPNEGIPTGDSKKDSWKKEQAKYIDSRAKRIELNLIWAKRFSEVVLERAQQLEELHEKFTSAVSNIKNGSLSDEDFKVARDFEYRVNSFANSFLFGREFDNNSYDLSPLEQQTVESQGEVPETIIRAD